MRGRRLTATAVVAGAIVFGTSACGSGPGPSSSSAPPTASSPSASSDPPAADASAESSSLLAFTSPAIGGGSLDGATFQGRPTLLWFWSPW